MEIRSHKSLKNDGVLRDELSPIDRLRTRDRSALMQSQVSLAPDRSAPMPRSIGAASVRLACMGRSIGWFIAIDRQALGLFTSRLCNFCRSIGCYAAIDRRWLCLCLPVFLCSKMFRFVYFFTSVSVLVLKSPVHSQNSLNNINFRNLTTIQA